MVINDNGNQEHFNYSITHWALVIYSQNFWQDSLFLKFYAFSLSWFTPLLCYIFSSNLFRNHVCGQFCWELVCLNEFNLISYFSSCFLVLNPSISMFLWCIEIPVPGFLIVHWDYSLWFQLTSLVTNFSGEKWSGSMTYLPCHCWKPRTEKENKETHSVTLLSGSYTTINTWHE